MKRLLCLLLGAALLLGAPGCAPGNARYQATRYDLFDTPITLMADCPSQQALDEMAEIAFGVFERLHRLFDRYHPYEGINNVYALNAAAGGEPLAVEPELMALLRFGIDCWETTDGRVNIALGAVLALWHDARERAVLPEESALRAAGEHGALSSLVLDEQAGTAVLTDPLASLDVGAIAKGWAAGKAADALREAGYTDFVLSAGGNVVAAGGGQNRSWRVGVQDPDDPSALCATVEVRDLAVVTSGGYQRYTDIGGVRYHHLIDPDTLYPGDFVRSASVVHPDSALADALSTACFLLPPDEALALCAQNGARLILVDKTGAVYDSDSVSKTDWSE